MDWTVITDFGDSGAMLPVAALILVWLAANGRVQPAALWAGLFGLQAAFVAATKIAFRGWGIGSAALDFTGVSGHSMLACSVIPVACSLVAREAGRRAQIAAALLGGAAGILIGISRLELRMHSVSEVVAGCLLGGLVALVFVAFADNARGSARLPTPVIAAVLAGVVLLMHGYRAPSEQLITRIALHMSGHRFPYTRYDLLHDDARERDLTGPAAPAFAAASRRQIASPS